MMRERSRSSEQTSELEERWPEYQFRKKPVDSYILVLYLR
jgi:hypothetical protein